jgi:hypothetical protein
MQIWNTFVFVDMISEYSTVAMYGTSLGVLQAPNISSALM